MVGGRRRARGVVQYSALCFGAILFGSPQDPAAAGQHADRAAEYLQTGDLQHAEAELRTAIALAPGDASYLTSLGGVLGMQGKLPEANVYFERAVKTNPADTLARRNLAANQWRLGQLKQAQANLELLLHAQPQDAASILLLGMVEENLRDYVRAARLLASVPDAVAQRPESVAALASAYYHTSQREKAHQLLEGLYGRIADPQGIFAAGGVAAQAGDYGIAEKLFESVRASYPDRTRLGYNLALIQFRTGRAAESQKTLIELVNAGRGTSEIYSLLGQCYQEQGNTAEAVRQLENAIRQDPSKEYYYQELTAILLGAKRLPAALKVASRMTEAFPKSAAAFRTRGLVETKMDQYTDAVRSFKRAVALDPSSLDAHLGLASAQWGAGMHRDAQTAFERLVKQHPRDAEVHEAYGAVLLEGAADDTTETRAAMLLKTALELDANRAEAHYQLGNLALKQDQTADAFRHLEAAARLTPRESKIQFALGRLYRRLGRAEDAANAMRRYEELKTAEGRGSPQAELRTQGK